MLVMTVIASSGNDGGGKEKGLKLRRLAKTSRSGCSRASVCVIPAADGRGGIFIPCDRCGEGESVFTWRAEEWSGARLIDKEVSDGVVSVLPRVGV